MAVPSVSLGLSQHSGAKTKGSLTAIPHPFLQAYYDCSIYITRCNYKTLPKIHGKKDNIKLTVQTWTCIIIFLNVILTYLQAVCRIIFLSVVHHM